MNQVFYIVKSYGSGSLVQSASEFIVNLMFIGLSKSDCNMIIPDFVRPIHYSIFEDE